MQACPKCGYLRKATDTAPEWQCPSCGIAYAKYLAVHAGNSPAEEHPAPPAKRGLDEKPRPAGVIPSPAEYSGATARYLERLLTYRRDDEIVRPREGGRTWRRNRLTDRVALVATIGMAVFVAWAITHACEFAGSCPSGSMVSTVIGVTSMLSFLVGFPLVFVLAAIDRRARHCFLCQRRLERRRVASRRDRPDWYEYTVCHACKLYEEEEIVDPELPLLLWVPFAISRIYQRYVSREILS